ncbi:MAG: DUF4249 family protein [Bacteroidales bacterium]|nr:DUF4249 family protein [Bacteroidales bacterium]
MRNLIWILVFVMAACEEQADWDFDGQTPLVLVVDGLLTDEVTRHEVRLTFPVRALNETPPPASGAEVYILFGLDGDTLVEALAEDPLLPGTYRTGPDYRGYPGRYYHLLIRYAGMEFRAVDFMRTVWPFAPFGYKPSPDNAGMYELVFPENQFANPDPAIWCFHLNWSHVPGSDPGPNGTRQAKLVYYTLPSIDVNGLFLEDYQTVPFPAGTRIALEKYAISEQYAEYLRTVLAETDWRGGVFDIHPANAGTNLSAGAIGYFAACTVYRDTVFVE